VVIRFSIIAGLGLLSAGCGGDETSSRASVQGATVSAKIATAALTAAPTLREAVGTIRSTTTSAIQSKNVGHVTAVHVTAGNLVDAGALLAEIDSRDADAQVKSAESGLVAAQRSFDEATQGLAAAHSAVNAAEAQGDLAAATFERQTKLLAEKAISKQVFDEAEAAAKSADAEARMRAEEVSAALARRERAAASIEQAQATLDAAKAGLSYTRMTAPFAGIIASKSVDVGDLAAPGMTLFVIEDRQSYRLEANVDESTVSNVHVNDSVAVTVDGVSEGPLNGTVAEIVPAADPASRTSVVKIALPANGALRSGQFGRAQFSSGESPSLSVPRSALVVRGQLEGVYAVDANDVARLRLIKTGKSIGDRVEVLSGLIEGDRFVAEVTPEVADGTRIGAL
jgi:multidrug efflux pump subunit AcrA (membrane-fusion protein)